MKIRLFSDLHLEFAGFEFDHIYVPRDDDHETTLLLSGDISIGTTAIPFILKMCERFRHVVYVPGNHEYYHNEFEDVNAKWQEWELNEGPPNFHFLYNDWRILDGVRILGGTMWTDFAGENELVMGYAVHHMNDYGMIRRNGLAMDVPYILNEHKKFRKFLAEKLAEPFDGKTIVMSHHSPGNGLRRRGRRVMDDDFYFADLEYYIGNEDKITLWTHGHTHRNWDYMINNTRVVCNPFGYRAHNENGEFNPEIVIQI